MLKVSNKNSLQPSRIQSPTGSKKEEELLKTVFNLGKNDKFPVKKLNQFIQDNDIKLSENLNFKFKLGKLRERHKKLMRQIKPSAQYKPDDTYKDYSSTDSDLYDDND